jgi:hypothetical protein
MTRQARYDPRHLSVKPQAKLAVAERVTATPPVPIACPA